MATNRKQLLYYWPNVILSLLYVSNFSYLGYLIILAYFNRFTCDDYCFMQALNENGYWGAVRFWYKHWQGRFGPHLIENLVIQLTNYFNALFLYLITVIGLYIYALSKILKHVILEKTAASNKLLLFILSTLIFNIHVINNFDFTTLHWLSASVVYFAGLAFALLGVSEMLSNSTKIYSYFLLLIGFIYAGSSSEGFGAICVFLLFLLLIYRILNSYIQLNVHIFLNKEVVAFFACVTAFLIMFAAPGNKIRQSSYPEPSITNAIIVSFESLGVLFSLIMAKLPLLLVLPFPFIYLGIVCRNTYSKSISKLFISLILGSIVCVLFLWISLLPNSYALSYGIEPQRSLTYVAFSIVCFLCYFYFLIGYRTLFNRNFSLALSMTSCMLIFILSLKGYMVNFPETMKYVRSHDRMIEQLTKLRNNGNKDTIYLDELYLSEDVVFIVNDISTDYVNKCVSSSLNLGYNIILKKNQLTMTNDPNFSAP